MTDPNLYRINEELRKLIIVLEERNEILKQFIEVVKKGIEEE